MYELNPHKILPSRGKYYLHLNTLCRKNKTKIKGAGTVLCAPPVQVCGFQPLSLLCRIRPLVLPILGMDLTADTLLGLTGHQFLEEAAEKDFLKKSSGGYFLGDPAG